MSLNKVLNRPLFRQEALRKGALRPIRAANGDFIGPRRMGDFIGPMPSDISMREMPKPSKFQRFKNFVGKGISGLKGTGKEALKTGPGGVAIYGGLEAIDPRLAAGVATGEIGLLGARFLPGAKNFVNKASRFTPFGLLSGMSFPRATGLGLAAYGGGKLIQGFKNRAQEREFVKEYAKRNNIDVEEALNLYERDLPGLTRGFSNFRTSDLAKATTIASRDFKESATPLTEEQKDKIANINEAIEKRYNYQDLDALASDTKKAKSTLDQGVVVEESMTSDPDTEMMTVDQANRKEIENLTDMRDKAAILTGQIMNKYNITDQLKALNIASAMTEGLISEDNIQTILGNENEYAKIPNKANDPNHPTAVAEKPETIQESKENPNVTLAKSLGYPVENEQSTPSGDREIDLGKKFLVDLQNPRETEINPKSYFLTKLALGLISGKTNKGGLAGAVEIAATVMGPAFDGAIALKMKNDENYRDFVTAVTDRNMKLYKMFNDDKKLGKYDNGSILIDGIYREGKQDRNTGNFFLVDERGGLIPVNPNQGTFFKRVVDKNYFDQIKLLSDGYIAQDLLQDSIALFEDPNVGDKVVGPAALILSAADTLKDLPGAVLDGIKGAGGDFTYSPDPELTEKENKAYDKRINNALKRLEDQFGKALKNPKTANDAAAAKVLGQLEVNARFLTYQLANSLKEKDRLTNRDLILLEELTDFKLFKNRERLREKYRILLERVKQKNEVRRKRFGTFGNSDLAIQNIIGGLVKATQLEGQPQEKTKAPVTTEDAFDVLIKKAIPN